MSFEVKMPGRQPYEGDGGIEAIGQIAKIQTMADRGLRIIIDLPETEEINVMALMPFRQNTNFKIKFCKYK
jgi:hypothetical protein